MRSVLVAMPALRSTGRSGERVLAPKMGLVASTPGTD